MRFVALLIALFLLPFGVRAEVSAILIGVSDYADSSGITDLKGPANDIRLLRDVLRRRGVVDMQILADGVDGGIRPTRAAILKALADKAEAASPGDFVFIHFSGHGTQQKDLNGDETDGLDEVLLPADTAPAPVGTGQIINAITDDDIGQAVDRIRAKGANVWLVLDSCHSGSGLRAATPGTATRFVDPAVLGVTGVPTFGPAERATDADLPQGSGGVVAFYSAQSSELAREVDLGDGTFYGLFTAKLAARLDGGGGQSFRQLFQAVLRDMNDSSVPGAARMQTPLWSGDLIDAAVFGDASTSDLRRYALRDDGIEAGLVHGLADGTLIGLVGEASDPADAVIGYAQMELTEAGFAFLRPVAETCVPRSDALCPAVGALPEAAKFGQVMARPVDLVVTFSPPVDARDGTELAEAEPAYQALVAALDAADGTVALDRDAYDVAVSWDGEALWFGPRPALQDRLVGRRWALEDAGLEGVITQIARAETLARLLGSLGGGSSILNPSPVTIEATLSPVALADVLPAGTQVPPMRECRRAISNRDPAASGVLEDGARVKQCDAIDVQVQGRTGGARDVNRIHIDAKYCIHNAYARVVDASTPTSVGGGMVLCSNCPDGYSAGDERLFVVVSEATPNSAALNLTGLIENCAPQTSGTRSARAGAVDLFVSSLAQGRATRGSLGALGVSNIWVDAYRWTILPKEIALSMN